MRLSLIAALILVCSPAAAQDIAPPDAAPSVEVDEVVLAPFEPTRDEAVLEAYVDGVVAAHRREHDAPAVTVSVVRDGRVLFAKAYGDADIEAQKPASGVETMFRIGSVSKTFVWTAVMMLHERGLIDLDADVNAYLKDMQLPEAFGAPVTMNHLMAHRAGFEDTLAVFTYRDDGGVSLTDALKDTMPKRVYAPGARTSYSNWGSALAAKVVEDVSGVSFRTFLDTEILSPLALTHTTIEAPSLMTVTDRAAMATGYDIKAGAYKPTELMEIGPFAPAGAIASTASDMAQWMLLHLGGGAHDGVRLLRSETHRLMWTRGFDDRPGGADLAHGFMTSTYRGVDTFGHGGATAAFYTNMTMVPELGVGVFVSQSTGNNRKLVSDLPWLVIDHLLDRPAAMAQDDPDFADKAGAFAGNYLGNRRSFSQFEKLFAATDVVTVAPAEGGLTLSGGGAAYHYAPVPGAADTFEDRVGDRVVFGRDENGRVTHFSDGSGVHSLERVSATTNATLLNLALGLALLFSITTLLGAWRRQASSGVVQKPAGAVLGVGALAGATLVLILTGLLIAVAATLAQAGPSIMLSYPTMSITALRLVALVVFAAALVGVVSLWPAWRASGWSIWRKLHHTLFALALAGLGAMLVFWNVIFAGTA